MDRVEAEIVGRRVAVALERGNARWAHAIIDEVMGREPRDLRDLTVGERMELPISALFPADMRLVNKLESRGIMTVGELWKTSLVQLLESPLFGPAKITQIREALTSIGLEPR